ncbi:MAG TPA: hypothetical protein VF008_26830 [Niastella sp.]
MKNYFLLLLPAMVACNPAQRTTKGHTSPSANYSVIKDTVPTTAGKEYVALEQFNKDTLKYVQSNFIARKDYYVGKEFGVLLNDLQVPIQKYVTGSSHLEGISPFITVKFYTNLEIYAKETQRINPVIMNIEWKTPVPYDQANELSRKYHMNWSEEVKNYYSKQVIGNITLVEYGF